MTVGGERRCSDWEVHAKNGLGKKGRRSKPSNRRHDGERGKKNSIHTRQLTEWPPSRGKKEGKLEGGKKIWEWEVNFGDDRPIGERGNTQGGQFY